MHDRPELAASLAERAASHQLRALARLRQAQDPRTPLSATRRRELVAWALEHLMRAGDLLRNAEQNAAGNGELQSMLDAHLTRLASVTESAERLLETPRGADQDAS